MDAMDEMDEMDEMEKMKKMDYKASMENRAQIRTGT